MSNEAASPFDLAVDRRALGVRTMPADARAEPQFAVERVTAAGMLARLTEAQAAGAAATPFQSAAWLAALDAVVAPALAAASELIWVTDAGSHDLIVALPITVRRAGGLRVAEIADLGVADYQAPLIGPAAASVASDATACAALLVAIKHALGDVDLLRFEKMPHEVAGRVNPLAMLAGVRPSRFSANRLTVETTVDAFIAARGKKYRKEAERCFRRIADQGEVRFARAETAGTIDAAYAQLESWQHARHAEAGHVYSLDRPELCQFYRRLAVDGASCAPRFASIFTLTVDGLVVAILYGVEYAGTFTLLRIADAGDAWKQVSPGRLVVIETMRHMVDRGISNFDMGIGDYPFKRWIGCSAHPLVDLEIALTWRALPRMAAGRLKQRLRESQRTRALVRRLKALAGKRSRPEPAEDGE